MSPEGPMCYIAGEEYEPNSPEFWEAVGRRNWRDGRHRERPFEFRNIVERIEPSRPVLEIGCGFGYLADYMPSGTAYVGVDLSSFMIDTARGLHPSGCFMCADIWEMAPHWQNAFGTVVAQQWVEHYAEPEAACRLAIGMAQHCLIINVPREEPEDRNAAHRWNDISEGELRALLEAVSPPDGEVDLFPGHSGHIDGRLRWR